MGRFGCAIGTRLESVNLSAPDECLLAAFQDCANHIFGSSRIDGSAFTDYGNPDYHRMWGTKVRRATGLECSGHEFPVVVGVDVGGIRKGFHLAVLLGSAVLDTLATGSASEVVECHP